jgi:gas vesicle protein
MDGISLAITIIVTFFVGVVVGGVGTIALLYLADKASKAMSGESSSKLYPDIP